MVTYPYAHMAYIMLYCVEWDVKLYHTIPPPLAGLAGGHIMAYVAGAGLPRLSK